MFFITEALMWFLVNPEDCVSYLAFHAIGDHFQGFPRQRKGGQEVSRDAKHHRKAQQGDTDRRNTAQGVSRPSSAKGPDGGTRLLREDSWKCRWHNGDHFLPWGPRHEL